MPAPNDPLELPAQFIKGVGPQRAEKLARLGLHNPRDLLFHLPRDYQDLTNLRRIADLESNCEQTVCGTVVDVDARPTSKGGTVTGVLIDDNTGRLVGIWFNQLQIMRRFQNGESVLFFGKPQMYDGRWRIVHPEFQHLDDGTTPDPYLPVYGLTEDLRAGELRRILRHVVTEYASLVPEVLPRALLEKKRYPAPAVALLHAHFPPDRESCRLARRRLAYDELLPLQLALALRHRDFRDVRKAPIFEITPKIDERIRRLFPFRFTAGQNAAVDDLTRDLASGRPMNRLLQADVGAGKTAVACYATLLAVAHQHQAAILAPTEVLARQHWDTLQRYLSHSRVRRQLLTGSVSPRERDAFVQQIRAGEVDLVVGTHALLHADVEFKRLGLVVIDEQHKFGVKQRARLRQKGLDPHYLIMTATPIPRTLAMTVFGDLDTTVIRDLPAGRQPVRTYLVTSEREAQSFEFLRRKLCEGRQAFVICPLVEQSESLGLQSAEQTAREWSAGPLSGFSCGLVHGRLNDLDKEITMRRFRDGHIKVLISTSVVEVGVDVPNATLMIVRDAFRFGLSQLHQFRGRVSRGQFPGCCFLFGSPRTSDAEARLRILVTTNDGFRIAEEDLRLRGPGEFLGTRQHGLPELRVANLLEDADVIAEARQDAFELLGRDPRLEAPEHAALRQSMLDRFAACMELGEIG